MNELNYYEKNDLALKHLNNGAFLTTMNSEKLNTMTISWGSTGFFWNKPVFVVAVRKSRFTHEIIESSKEFTVSIPFNILKTELNFCGTKSGKYYNKFDFLKLNINHSEKIKTPAVNCKGIHYECKVIFQSDMEKFPISDDINPFYQTGDLHTMYFGEILRCYEI